MEYLVMVMIYRPSCSGHC